MFYLDNRYSCWSCLLQIFPRIKDTLQGGILLFVRSYFDFVRLRNYLKAQNSSFCLLGEYTKQSDISRGRSWFYHGKRRIMLYTERAHFYHRYKIRGIRNLMFYSLPNHPQFYAEISNLLEGVENPSCTVLFSKFDNLQLERIVGTSRAQRMLNSKTSTFMFC
jgi:U3 small nucleolar RNA-associated protein 25